MNYPKTNLNKPVNSAKTPRSKRKLIVVLISAMIVLALLVVAGIAIAKSLHKPNTVSETKLLTKTPVNVGSYRYVNACQAIPTQSYKEVFGYEMTNNNSVINTYADGNRSKLANYRSECSTQFGNVKLDIGGGKTTDSSLGTMSLRLNEYTNTKQPATDVDFYGSQKGQDVDLSALGIDDTITTSTFETIPVDGINVYNNTDQVGRFYFAYRNISAAGSIEDLDNPEGDPKSFVQPDYVKQVISKYVATIKQSIDNAQLAQEPLAISNVGKPVKGGDSAKIIAACDYFTSDDFKTITGSYDDSTQVTVHNDLNPTAYAADFNTTKQATSGIGHVQCTRKGYINTVQPSIASYPDFKDFLPADQKYKDIEYPIINETINYYNTKQDAIDGVKFHESTNSQTYPDTKNTTVSGLGSAAAFSEYTFTTDIANIDSATDGPKELHLYVAKGSYVIDIDMYYSSGNTNVIRRGTADQYKQAATLLAARLAS